MVLGAAAAALLASPAAALASAGGAHASRAVAHGARSRPPATAAKPSAGHRTRARRHTGHTSDPHRASGTRVLHVGTGSEAQAAEGTGTASVSPPAATVLSFRGGVLEVRLLGGGVLKGMVNRRTSIACAPSLPVEVETPEEEGSGEEGGEEGEGAEEAEPEPGAEEAGEAGLTGEAAAAAEPQQTCTRADLVRGAAITDAMLAVGRHRSAWTRVELLR
jgi:hypothetical protein